MLKQHPGPHTVIIVLSCPSVMEAWSRDVRKHCTPYINEMEDRNLEDWWQLNFCGISWYRNSERTCLLITRAEAEEYDQSLVICWTGDN